MEQIFGALMSWSVGIFNMATIIPKPGDKIIITKASKVGLEDTVGKTYMVLECPEKWKNSKFDTPDLVWVKYASGSVCDIATYPPANFEIVTQSSKEKRGVCKDCGGTGKVTLLNFTHDCKCVKNT